jgi:predicted RNase H-like HicB family nuclease
MKPKFTDYSFEIKPLAAAEGGGFLITFPDLPGCMSDGETPEEAIENGKDAFDCWMEAQVEWGRPIQKASMRSSPLSPNRKASASIRWSCPSSRKALEWRRRMPEKLVDELKEDRTVPFCFWREKESSAAKR